MTGRTAVLVLVLVAGLGLAGCTGGPDEPAGPGPSPAVTPAGLQRAGGVVVLTAEVVPLGPDEFETGSGVGGTTELGPAGCLTVRSGGEGPRMLLVAPAGSRLADDHGTVALEVDGSTLRVGDGFDGGRGLRAPYDVTAAEAYPDLADELPAPCRRLPVFVVDEVYEVFPAR